MINRLYIAETLPAAQTIFWVGFLRGSLDVGQTLFTNTLPKDFALTSIVAVPTVEEADYLLFPHAIKEKNDPLLPHLEAVKANAKGKPVLVFVGGDLSHDIFLEGVIVLKGSQYGYLLKENELIVPPLAEDFADLQEITVRKKGGRPSISFCGWAGFSSPLQYVKYLVRNMSADLQALCGNTHAVVHKKGLYWRRRSISLLSKDARIDTRFIVRRSFSANAKTIELDPVVARTEYLDSLSGSDYVLAPKGDGNFSVRFYEALSMGRIPIVIDTDMVFPLEGIVPYEEFVLRIPYTDVDRIADIVSEFHAGLTTEAFETMQRSARAAYRTYLRYDVFTKTLMERMLPALRSSVAAKSTAI